MKNRARSPWNRRARRVVRWSLVIGASIVIVAALIATASALSQTTKKAEWRGGENFNEALQGWHRGDRDDEE